RRDTKGARWRNAGRGGQAPSTGVGSDQAGARSPKKIHRLLRERQQMSPFEIVDAEKANYPVSLVCEAVGVSRSGYYAWKHAEPSEREKQNERLLVEIRALHERHRERYGSPRIHQELQ